MINIRIDPGGLTVNGHAGKDPPEHSLICCAVSTLVQSLAFALESFVGDTVTSRLEPGDSCIRWGELGSDGKAIVDAFWLGLSTLAAQYPENITVN